MPVKGPCASQETATLASLLIKPRADHRHRSNHRQRQVNLLIPRHPSHCSTEQPSCKRRHYDTYQDTSLDSTRSHASAGINNVLSILHLHLVCLAQHQVILLVVRFNRALAIPVGSSQPTQPPKRRHRLLLRRHVTHTPVPPEARSTGQPPVQGISSQHPAASAICCQGLHRY